MKSFEWIPGVGVDATALDRLRARFKRPCYPLPVGYLELPERFGRPAELSPWELSDALERIVEDTCVFGPIKEMDAWYNYLLVELLPRSHEYFLVEMLASCLFALHPSGVLRQPYSGFLDDILGTLGRCMMERRCWNGDDIVVGSMLHRSDDNHEHAWFWWDASGDFSASMYLCLKYLPPTLVEGWFESVLAIRSPHWRAQVLVWLVGSHPLLRGEVASPSLLPAIGRPSVAWESYDRLGNPPAMDEPFAPRSVASFVPKSSREHALAVTKRFFTASVFDSWLDSIRQVSYLESELADIPSSFESLYVAQPN